MTSKLSLKDLSLKDKRVLMRVDFNVPLDKKGNITDDTRIQASLPSIRYILDQGGSLILMSHLGRPDGQTISEFSLAPISKHLSILLQKPVIFSKDCIGPEVKQKVDQLKPGQILLLENLRFHHAEENPKSDPAFAKELASLGDVYVNDAFGTAHRAHASTAEIAQYFPKTAAAGFLMEKEIEFLGAAVMQPKRPFFAIIGGAKISSKLGIIRALLKKADAILIGGGMAYTFLKAKGVSIGDSLCENDLLEAATIILEESKLAKVPIFLPLDHIIAKEVSEQTEKMICTTAEGIPTGFKALDIGPKTVQEFSLQLQKAKTVFWNGPLGLFEVSAFAAGTNEIAKVLSNLSATTIVGGGDSIAALKAAGLENKISHISTGGGASLEYIELGSLPGIDVLTTKAK